MLSNMCRNSLAICVALGCLVLIVPGSFAQNIAAAESTVPAQLAQAEVEQPESALWNALRSGDHFALLRHAVAPGSGDPAGFNVDDCTTQRNLSDGGRDQASRIGARFRSNGIVPAAVFSSRWCRCLETARLLGLGPVTEQPVLNSFFQDFERREPQTRALRHWIAKQELTAPLILVTHQVNITALTNVFPQSGELVIVRRSKTGTLLVVGTIRSD